MYVESVLFYNVGTWRVMTPRQAEQVHTRYLKGLRTATHTGFFDLADNERITDATVLALAERPPETFRKPRKGVLLHPQWRRHWMHDTSVRERMNV